MPRYEFECQDCYYINLFYLNFREYEKAKENNFKNLKCEECGTNNLKRTMILGVPSIKVEVNKGDAIEDWRKIQKSNLESGFEKTDKLRKNIIKQRRIQKGHKSDEYRKKDYREKYNEEILGPEKKRKEEEFKKQHPELFNKN